MITEEQIDSYKRFMIALDMVLTGHSLQDCVHTANCTKKSPEDLLTGNIYYLSDGGYSRIAWDLFHDRGIFVCSESLQRVKDAFSNDENKKLINEINTFLREIEQQEGE